MRDMADKDDDLTLWEHPLWAALVKTVLVLSIAALGGGYLGWLHPAGDSLSVFRGIAAAAVFIAALLAISAGMRHAAFGAILLSILTGTSVVLAHVWPGPPGTVTLYQKNLLYRNAELAALEADIRAAAPQALTLQEMSEPNRALLANLADMLPTQLHCPLGARGGTAVASALPGVPGSAVCAPGLSAMQVVYRDAPVWIVSVHLSWPWPMRQAAHATEIAGVLAGLEGPVLMGGDFNMARWGHSVQRLAAVAGVRPAGPMRGSFLGFGPLLRLPLDHVLAPYGGRVEYRPALGSDHLGLLARLAL